MTNELDDFLNQQQQEKQKQREKEEQAKQDLQNKIYAFDTAFKELLEKTIYPTMVELLENVRKNSTYATHVHDRKMKNLCYHQSYYIGAHSFGDHVLISVMGNFDLQKVCIDTEYFEYIQGDGSNKSLKKTPQQYDLAQITPALLESTLLNAIKGFESESH
ncbi:MAG: hypothetical protein ACYDCN_11965 [Bacteroidia bacterium]